MLNCKETVEKLYGYLDRQLTEEEAIEVREHLDNCGHCDDHFRFEQNVLTRVHRACRDVKTPPELRSRVQKMCSSSHQEI